MNELITIAGKELTMSSREIAELCEKEHKVVIRDIRSMLISLYGEEYLQKVIPEKYRNRHSEYIRENADSILNAIFEDGTNWCHEKNCGFSWSRDSRGYVEIFNLDKEHSLTLVAGYNVKLRKAIIDRWQQLEEQTSHQIPQTYSEALRLAADLADQNKLLQDEVKEIKPQAQAFKRIAASDETLTFTQASKVIGVKRNALISDLHAGGWIYRQNGSWVAYDEHIKNGNLVYKEASYTDEETELKVIKPYCHLTQKGLSKLVLKYQVEAA